MFKLTMYAAVAAVLMPGISYAQAQLNGVVSGKDGQVLSGAYVIVENSSGRTNTAFTDYAGGFQFSGLVDGLYPMMIRYLGYETYRDTVELSGPSTRISIALIPLPFLTDEVVVEATRLSPNAPATFQNIDKEELSKLNLGQDLPFLIGWTPSLVATSDAGAGIGYTGIRIRGSDQTRINVTVNGIPINDPESQGVFWVNMPDLASSLSSVQIQRGLGSSTNGSGAFGASINMETAGVEQEAGALISNSFGSFNTRRHTVQFNSGRLGNGFAMEGRLSQIASDGYIDRASSDLRSYYLSGGYYGKKTMVKAVTFSGKERTYQSWNGTPQSRLENDTDGMLTHAANEGYTEAQLENLLTSGRTYNFYQYENEVDDYQQDHYQLHATHMITPELKISVAGHYTYGRGFFEQYRQGEDWLNDYGKPYPVVGTDTIFETDLIRRRWLENDFYGSTYSLNYQQGRHDVTLGGGSHFYRGDHFGEIVWAEFAGQIAHNERYYEGVGNKDDHSTYLKWQYGVDKWNLMADLQVRQVDYETFGMDNDLVPIDVKTDFLFFNPKAGVRYNLTNQSAVYAYLGRGNREPVRNDFIDAPEGVRPVFETLNNLEIGYNLTRPGMIVNINGYYMDYRNQLVATGELNDVGAIVRRNVDESYRAGIEADLTFQIVRRLRWNVNATFSRNKIQTFDEVTYDYSVDFDVINTRFIDTDIAFSPGVIAASRIMWTPAENLEIDLISKYVGDQYLDNTQNEDRKIEAYTTTDFRIAYRVENLLFKEIEVSLLVNNIFDALYSSNGYTYSYIAGTPVTENFYYPQAGINFLAGLNLRF